MRLESMIIAITLCSCSMVTLAARTGIGSGCMLNESNPSKVDLPVKGRSITSDPDRNMESFSEPIQLTRTEMDPGNPNLRATWSEVGIDTYPSGSGLVDVVMGDDGHIYCAFYDDGISSYGSVYVKRSTDGGASWGNPDGGANGFAMYGMFLDRPSIVVFETDPGDYRLAVATSAPWPLQGSPNDILICWKDIGDSGSGPDFTVTSVQNYTGEDFLIPRLKVIDHPTSGAKRIVCASYAYSNGQLRCDRSDSNAASWGSFQLINPATDQANVWRADFIEDTGNGRLYCTWPVGLVSAPDTPRVLMALSTDQGASWYPDLYAMSPSGWDFAGESDAAVASNPLQTGKTLMMVWTGAELPSDNLDIYYSYQQLDDIDVGAGVWDPSPPGYPVTYGILYSDTDFMNSMPAIVEDNRLPGGGYRVAFLDQYSSGAARVLYSECTFSAPFSWLAPEQASAPGADPARDGSNALSMGVGYCPKPGYPLRRCAVWPDYRASNMDVYASFADVEPTVPPVVPVASPVGLVVLTGLLALALRKRAVRSVRSS